MHLFFSKHFTSLNNMDSMVVFGSTVVYWGLGSLFFLKCYPEFNGKKSIRTFLSDMIQLVAAGSLMYYFLLLFCCWVLALYEGYIPMIFDDLYQNHGPWRFVSHLKLLILWSSLQVVLSLKMSVLSFLIKFNRQSLILIVISICLFVFNVYTHLWLIDWGICFCWRDGVRLLQFDVEGLQHVGARPVGPLRGDSNCRSLQVTTTITQGEAMFFLLSFLFSL